MQLSHRISNGAVALRRTSWLQLAGYGYLAFLLLMLARMALPADLSAALRPLGLMLPLALIVAKDLAHAPDALGRLRSATGWGERVAALLPPELVGMVRLDRLMWSGFAQWLLRRKPTPAPQGVELTYLRRGAYGTAIGVAMVSLLLELPVNVLVINLWIDHADTRLLIHVVGGIGVLYSFVWVLGDRWHVGGGCHVLADGILHLRVGVRSHGSIALGAIERCDRVDEAPEHWRRRHGIHASETLLVTPFDKPNCVLVMKPDAGASLLHWQVRRAAPRYVLMYVDRPELLASWVDGGSTPAIFPKPVT